MAAVQSKKSSRHALVLWVNENKLSILDTSFIKDKKMLDDPERVGMVEHGCKENKPPKEGWQIYPARVLSASGDIKKLREKEQKWLEQHKPTSDEDGKGHRIKKRCFKLMEEELVEEDKACEGKEKRKKMEAAQRMAQDDIFHEIDHVENPLSIKLEETQRRLKEMEALNIQLQQGIPKMIEIAVINALKQTMTCANPTRVEKPEATHTQVNEEENEEVDGKPMLQDMVNTNVWIEDSKSNDYKKITRILMRALFTTEELTTRCVKSTNQNNKEPVDQEKVSLILGYIMSRFTCDAVAVRAVMAQKLKDERNFHKKTKNTIN